MEIKININKPDAEHLKYCGSKHDACDTIERIINKIERAIKNEKKNKKEN